MKTFALILILTSARTGEMSEEILDYNLTREDCAIALTETAVRLERLKSNSAILYCRPELSI